MQIGLTSRIFIAMILCAILLATVGLSVWQHIAYEKERDRLSVKIATASVRLSKAIIGAADRGDMSAVQDMISAFAASPEIICVAIDIKKHNISAFWPSKDCVSKHEGLFHHKQPIRRAIRVLGDANVYFTDRDIKDGIIAFNQIIASGLGILLAVMLSVMFIIHRVQINRPIVKITAALNRFARGEASVKLSDGQGAPEFQRISFAFDAMVDDLATKDEEIRQSLDYAKMIQDGIIGLDDGWKQSGFDIDAAQDQLVQIGGDFYAGIDLESHYIIFFADATGHGVPGAMATMLLASSLRNTAQRLNHNDSPCTWLGKIHKRFVESVANQNDGQHAQLLGADAVLLMIDKQSPVIHYASAGLPIFHKTDNISAIAKFDRTSIGYGFDSPVLTTHTLTLSDPGDMIVLATDGLLDQPGGEKGYGFGKKRMLACLDRISTKLEHAPAITRIINHNVNEFQGTHAPVDDRTLMTIKSH